MEWQYAVVLFENEEDCVSVVPTKWLILDDKFTYWPNKSMSSVKLSKAIKEKWQPESNWTKHTIRILKKTGKSYNSILYM